MVFIVPRNRGSRLILSRGPLPRLPGKINTMYKYILENAGNINWMAIFALLTFFLMFVISAVVVTTRRQGWINKMSNMPLEDNPSFNSDNSQ